MDYTIIEVPDLNDSLSRIVLSGKEYRIRFGYNDTHDYWKFGLYTALEEPIVVGIKIVPGFPLNSFFALANIPDGLFGVFSNKDRIGRYDFVEGNAKFFFCPVETEEPY